jgi:proline iminopeptidase
MEPQVNKATVGDIDIAYRRVGTGVPLVAVHGGPGIGHRYLRPLDAWTDEFELIYYDQRGTGHTELGDPDKVSFTGSMADLDGLRDHLGIERVNLVGYSFGAILALMYAASYADRVGSIVLLNPAPPFVPELANELWSTMAARRSEEDNADKEAIEASNGFATGDPATLGRYTLNMYTPFFSDRSWRDRAELGFTEITAANVGSASERMFRDLGSLDPVGSLAEIACPALVVHSENDAAPEAFSRLLADKIGSAEYQYLSGASHFVLLEDPDALAAAVKPFLRTFAR